MNCIRHKIFVLLTGWIIISITPFIFSCTYDKQFTYINDQINNLNRKTSTLQETIDNKISSLNEKLSTVNSNQAEMMVEIDRLKEDLKELSGRVEDNEHILKNSVEKDLTEQDAIRADLAKLGEISQKIEKLERVLKQQQKYLGLESLDTEEKQQEEQVAIKTAPEQGEAIEVGQQSEEGEMYNAALSLYRAEKYEQASEDFKKFLNLYPKSDLADNGQFWIGECHMALKQYEQAILAYQEVIKKYPKGNKVPNAMLRQAIAFLEINDKTSSKLLLKKVIKEFPDSSEAKIAQTKLKTIE
jgi:tol-pal system protein YbgF